MDYVAKHCKHKFLGDDIYALLEVFTSLEICVKLLLTYFSILFLVFLFFHVHPRSHIVFKLIFTYRIHICVCVQRAYAIEFRLSG